MPPEQTEEDWNDYLYEVMFASVGLGVGLSILFGLLAFIGMLLMCARCKRLKKADFAIAQAEAENDGELPGRRVGFSPISFRNMPSSVVIFFLHSIMHALSAVGSARTKEEGRGHLRGFTCGSKVGCTIFGS